MMEPSSQTQDFATPPDQTLPVKISLPNSSTSVVTSYARYGNLTQFRRLLLIVLTFLIASCLWNVISPTAQSAQFPAQFSLWLSGIDVLCGLTVVVLMMVEVFAGAGLELEEEIDRDGQTIRQFRFVPSISRLPLVLLFLGTCFTSFILGFASLYASLFRQSAIAFGGLSDGFLCIYFSLVTFSTVGYGDIYPASLTARGAATLEIVVAMFFSLVAISTTLSWVIAYERQQHDEMIRKRLNDRQQMHNR